MVRARHDHGERPALRAGGCSGGEGSVGGFPGPGGKARANVVGDLAIAEGGAVGFVEGGGVAASGEARVFVMIGICGGFTTFSSFSLQTLALARSGAWFAAGANVLLSVALCLVAVTLGHLLAERFGVGTRTF